MAAQGSPPGSRAADSSSAGVAQETANRVVEQASAAARQAKRQARSMLSEQKDMAAERLGRTAQVLRQAVDQLEQQSPGTLTSYAEQAVRSLDEVAGALREKDVDLLLADVEDFARRNPALFIGGTVAAGFLLARFLKSSSDRRNRGQLGENSSPPKTASLAPSGLGEQEGTAATQTDYPPTKEVM